MNVRKFIAATARDALRKVKETLGPDAIILSNRGIPGGVEIMAVAARDMDMIVPTPEREASPARAMDYPTVSSVDRGPATAPELPSVRGGAYRRSAKCCRTLLAAATGEATGATVGATPVITITAAAGAAAAASRELGQGRRGSGSSSGDGRDSLLAKNRRATARRFCVGGIGAFRTGEDRDPSSDARCRFFAALCTWPAR